MAPTIRRVTYMTPLGEMAAYLQLANQKIAEGDLLGENWVASSHLADLGIQAVFLADGGPIPVVSDVGTAQECVKRAWDAVGSWVPTSVEDQAFLTRLHDLAHPLP